MGVEELEQPAERLSRSFSPAIYYERGEHGGSATRLARRSQRVSTRYRPPHRAARPLRRTLHALATKLVRKTGLAEHVIFRDRA